jgi:hypothetical protein
MATLISGGYKISKSKKQEKIEPLFNKVCYIAIPLLMFAGLSWLFSVRETGRVAIVEGQGECTVHCTRSVCDRSHVHFVMILNLQSQTFS